MSSHPPSQLAAGCAYLDDKQHLNLLWQALKWCCTSQSAVCALLPSQTAPHTVSTRRCTVPCNACHCSTCWPLPPSTCTALVCTGCWHSCNIALQSDSTNSKRRKHLDHAQNNLSCSIRRYSQPLVPPAVQCLQQQTLTSHRVTRPPQPALPQQQARSLNSVDKHPMHLLAARCHQWQADLDLSHTGCPAVAAAAGSHHECPSLNIPCTSLQCDAINGKLSTEVWTIRVSFFVYVIALVTTAGWLLFMIFAGIGLVALPLDLIREFLGRPRSTISKTEYLAKAKGLGQRAKNIMASSA